MIFWHAGTTCAVLWFTFRGNTRIDYRIIAAASLLPDVIDLVTRSFYGHVLLLNVALLSIFFFFRGRKKRTLVLIPIASLLHLAEDAVWGNPRVFAWPIFGSPSTQAHDFAFSPIKELIGLALLVWLLAAHTMLNPAGVKKFFLTGHLE